MHFELFCDRGIYYYFEFLIKAFKLILKNLKKSGRNLTTKVIFRFHIWNFEYYSAKFF